MRGIRRNVCGCPILLANVANNPCPHKFSRLNPDLCAGFMAGQARAGVGWSVGCNVEKAKRRLPPLFHEETALDIHV